MPPASTCRPINFNRSDVHNAGDNMNDASPRAPCQEVSKTTALSHHPRLCVSIAEDTL